MVTFIKVRQPKLVAAQIITVFLFMTALRWQTPHWSRVRRPHKSRLPSYRDFTQPRRYVETNDKTKSRNGQKCSPSTTPVRPIRRSVHISEVTSRISVFTASGGGLHQATVGRAATFSVQLQDHEQVTDIHEGPFISALAVGQKHMFSISPSYLDYGSLVVNFSYTPTIPGLYDLYVEELKTAAQMQIPGSPFKLEVKGPRLEEEEVRFKADSLPSCQTIPHTDHTWADGEWVTRRLAGNTRGTLRSGWVYQPKRCSFDVFTAEDIELAAASPEPRTIVVIGRSTERGVFLSLVDLVLKRSEKRDIEHSEIWKCWGFAEIRLGNLRVIFQDFRIEAMTWDKIVDAKHVNITCHDDMKTSSYYGYFDDALAFIREVLFGEDRPWPDVIFLIAKSASQLRVLMREVPPSWNGVVYPTQNFKCHEGFRFTAEGRVKDIQLMEEFRAVDNRVRIVDAFALARTMRHTTQTGPLIMKTAHWHSICDEYDGDVRVCGDGAEIIAQLLLAEALAPEGKAAWLNSLDRCPGDRTNHTREIMICHDCPKSFLPHRIERAPNATCHVGLRLKLHTNRAPWDLPPCPKDCMETKPTTTMHTESKDVDVRVCTVPLQTDESS